MKYLLVVTAALGLVLDPSWADQQTRVGRGAGHLRYLQVSYENGLHISWLLERPTTMEPRLTLAYIGHHLIAFSSLLLRKWPPWPGTSLGMKRARTLPKNHIIRRETKMTMTMTTTTIVARVRAKAARAKADPQATTEKAREAKVDPPVTM
jgi:hypothetical protein